MIHGEKIKIEAKQGGKESGPTAQGETRAESGNKGEGIRQEGQGRGEKKEEGGHKQEEAICREKDRCSQNSGGQEKEAIREACKAGGARRQDQ